jgi:hypothetical protein
MIWNFKLYDTKWLPTDEDKKRFKFLESSHYLRLEDLEEVYEFYTSMDDYVKDKKTIMRLENETLYTT